MKTERYCRQSKVVVFILFFFLWQCTEKKPMQQVAHKNLIKPSGNEVYMYKNMHGDMVISNINDHGEKIALPALNVYAVAMSKEDIRTNGITPKIDLKQATNLRQDMDRKFFTSKQNSTRGQILEEELNKEESALIATTNMFKTESRLATEYMAESTYRDHLNMLKDSITEHKKNINLLNQELNF